jgi:hypothetical protein
MGFQATQSRYVHSLYAPYYGISPVEVVTEQVILGLSGRFDVQPITLNHTFTLNAPTGSNAFMYFAYPTSLGLCQFYDVQSQFYGGWDGANNDPFNVYGPTTVNVTVPSGEVVPFYVYRTDWPDLGSVEWQTSPAV